MSRPAVPVHGGTVLQAIAILSKAPENPWWRKARLHYEPLIEVAERSAAEADRLAEYHQFRAVELQGK